jgi:hypothetical protein
MTLNASYTPGYSLQEYFVDKVTGLPLNGGLVYFYSDVNRTTPKAVYTISGTPPNYIYTQLPNPVVLSSVGTPTDGNGNDIIIYYYPYDTNGNIELYYVNITDSSGNVQFTREGVPNLASSSSTSVPDITNYIPNGQLLLHNDNNDNLPTATIESIVYNPIAYGRFLLCGKFRIRICYKSYVF